MAIQSIVRAYEILKCFEGRDWLRITEISELTGLHKSTAFGLVQTLKEIHLLEQDETNGMYRLGHELFRLGTHVNHSIIDTMTPFINKLVSETMETVNLVVREGQSTLYIDKKESPHSMRICTRLGQMLPMYCTAAGKAIMAYTDMKEVKEILSSSEFVPYTDNTLKSAEEVFSELKVIKDRGFAIDNEELEYGLICVGVPLLDRHGSPKGALSVSGPTSRMTQSKINEIAEQVINYTKRIVYLL